LCRRIMYDRIGVRRLILLDQDLCVLAHR